MEIEQKELLVEYVCEGQKGTYNSPIYIVNNDLIIGKTIEQGYNMTLTGFKTADKLKFVKVPEISDWDLVYWEGFLDKNYFQGHFGFVPILTAHKKEMYCSIERSFNNLEKGILLIDETTSRLIEKIKTNPFNIPLDGAGSIYIK